MRRPVLVGCGWGKVFEGCILLKGMECGIPATSDRRREGQGSAQRQSSGFTRPVDEHNRRVAGWELALGPKMGPHILLAHSFIRLWRGRLLGMGLSCVNGGVVADG